MNFSIDKNLLRTKATYFILFLGIASLWPYIPVFMDMLKFSSTQIAIVTVIPTIISGVIRFFVGYLADKMSKRKLIYVLSSILSVVFFVAIYFLPYNENDLGRKIRDGNKLWYFCRTNSTEDDSSYSFTNQDVFLHIGSFNANGLDNIPFTGDEITLVANCQFNESDSCDKNMINDAVTFKLIPSLEKRDFYNAMFNSTILEHVNGSCLTFGSCTFSQTEKHRVYSKTIWLFFVLFLFAQTLFSPIYNILDSIIYSYLASLEKLKNYGKIRLWGTIGFGCGAFFSGTLMDIIPKCYGRMVYLINFVSYSVCLLSAALLVSLFLKERYPTKESKKSFDNKEITDNSNHMIKEILADGNENVELADQDVSIALKSSDDEKRITNTSAAHINFRELSKIFNNFYLVNILVSCMVAGILAGPFELFFCIYLGTLDETNNKQVMGICLLASCILEIVILYYSGKIMAFVGRARCLYIVFVTYTFRYICSSLITNVWYGVMTEASQSICFGIFYPVITSWASSLTPSYLQSTVQCCIGAIYFSFG
ncbi:hypothetical protein HELRODRAFT_165697 [Helobdella robusta]|uniref:Major facilitator superfamily associated domain-containing protein n=1 Tax=Helobdella robusta TaxID=6412 RepID=T1EX65_HELRO|nr:hypothetical protein HELRODRAFT_165697 [Helobdella robusta]ESN91644.1 hypothetical protein HELRODRAFT_165697 [Helobdella robusta]